MGRPSVRGGELQAGDGDDQQRQEGEAARVAGSWWATMPTRAVPTAPMPTQTA
jgi:hypothetical protein